MFRKRKGFTGPGAIHALLAVAIAALMAGCFMTKLQTEDSQSELGRQARQPDPEPSAGALSVKAQQPVTVGENTAPGAVTKVVESPKETIQKRLREADQLRLDIINDPNINSYYTKSELLDYNDNNIIMRYDLASYHGQKRNMDKARALYEEVLRMDPGNPQAQLGMGNLDVLEALSLANDYFDNEFYLGSSPGRTDQDKNRIKRRVAKDQEILKMKIESMTQAAKNKFNLVLAVSPQDTAAHFGLAMVLAISKDWAGATQKFDQLEKSNNLPQFYRSVFYVWYGFVLEQQGNRDGAKLKYLKAAELREPHQWGDWAQERVEMMYLYPPAKEYYTGSRF